MDSDAAPDSVTQPESNSAHSSTDLTPEAHAANTIRTYRKSLASAVSDPATAEPSVKDAVDTDSPVQVSNRAAVPPLLIEVVAGDKSSLVHPGSNVKKIEIPNSRPSVLAAAMMNQPTNAAERERISGDSAVEAESTISASYPTLGQNTNVWGSVVLQALISADGTIENLRVVSGPAILTSAALDAVRQWHFKPYLVNGSPVETKAKVTVNFSIKVRETPKG